MGRLFSPKVLRNKLTVLSPAKDGTIWWIEKSWQWIKIHQNTLQHSRLYTIEVGVGAESWQWIKTHQVNLNSWVHNDTKTACVPNVRCYRINSLFRTLTIKGKNQALILLFSCELSLAEEDKFRIIPAGKWRRNNMTLQPLVHEWIQVIILTAAWVIIKETTRLWTSSGVVLKKKPQDQWFLNVADHWKHLRIL